MIGTSTRCNVGARVRYLPVVPGIPRAREEINMRFFAVGSVLVLLRLFVTPSWSRADSITYVNWTSSTGPVSNTGTVSGTLFGSIKVTYSGELQFAQTGS